MFYCPFLVIVQDLEESEEYLRNCSRRIPTLRSLSSSLSKVRQIIHEYRKDVDYYDYVRYQPLNFFWLIAFAFSDLLNMYSTKFVYILCMFPTQKCFLLSFAPCRWAVAVVFCTLILVIVILMIVALCLGLPIEYSPTLYSSPSNDRFKYTAACLLRRWDFLCPLRLKELTAKPYIDPPFELLLPVLHSMTFLFIIYSATVLFIIYSATVMTFVFSWLFIILVFLTLFIGGNAHSLGCRSWHRGHLFEVSKEPSGNIGHGFDSGRWFFFVNVSEQKCKMINKLFCMLSQVLWPEWRPLHRL